MAVGLSVAGCSESSDGSAGTEALAEGGAGTATATEMAAETRTEAATNTGAETGTETTPEAAADVQGTVTAQSDDDLRIVEHTYYRRDDTEGVRGTVKNTGDTAFSYVEVHLSPKNEKDETLDRFEVDSREAIDSLVPGQAWQFDVAIDGDFEFTRHDLWTTGTTSA